MIQEPVLSDIFPAVFDSIAEGVFTVDKSYRITSFNREAERITGTAREDAIGQRCSEVFKTTMCSSGCAMRRTFQTSRPVRNVRVHARRGDGTVVPLRVTTAVLQGQSGGLLGGVEVFRDVSDVETLRKELEGRQVFEDIVGTSREMQEVFRLITDVAASEATVLLEGQSGTGKELVARAIHNVSERRRGPFVQVNCGALPDTLLESELFGYVRGAFTDAKWDKPGRFVQANHGTLFLDEIGDVSPAFQVKLLRVLEDKNVHPLGGTSSTTVDVRVIAATNQKLANLVRSGRFREDLFYRLHVVPIALPPLRARPQDIPLLVQHFIRRCASRTGKAIDGMSEEALCLLYDHTFPGNVRELENIIERAFVVCHESRIGPEHLPPEVSQLDRTVVTESASTRTPSQRIIETAQVEQSARSVPPHHAKMLAALDAHNWNRGQAAQALGISRTTLWRRMHDAGLARSRKKR